MQRGGGGDQRVEHALRHLGRRRRQHGVGRHVVPAVAHEQQRAARQRQPEPSGAVYSRSPCTTRSTVSPPFSNVADERRRSSGRARCGRRRPCPRRRRSATESSRSTIVVTADSSTTSATPAWCWRPTAWTRGSIVSSTCRPLAQQHATARRLAGRAGELRPGRRAPGASARPPSRRGRRVTSAWLPLASGNSSSSSWSAPRSPARRAARRSPVRARGPGAARRCRRTRRRASPSGRWRR